MVTHTTARQGLGRYGEDVAARRLVEAGMVVLDRNWRCAEGEIDLVLRDGDVLVVCEVKTRSGVGYGSPHEAVTPAKLERLGRLGERYAAGTLHPFEGPITRQDGTVVIPAGRRLSDDEIRAQNYFYQGIDVAMP